MITNASHPSFSSSLICDRESELAAAMARSLEKMKSLYRVDQQEKLLDLQAETESLFHQLQTLKEQQLAEGSPIQENVQEKVLANSLG